MALQSFLHIYNVQNLELSMVSDLAREMNWTGDSEIVDGKSFDVKSARDMIGRVARRPLHQENWRWVIVDAQLMSVPVADTLLKVIEEPPVYLSIHLLTNNPFKILPTILSRTMRVYHNTDPARPIDPSEILNRSELDRWRWAKEAAEDEDIAKQLSSWVMAFKCSNRWREAQLTADLVDTITSSTANKRLLIENYLIKMNRLAVDK